jgi:sirohydrochlorin ferrochelatase
VNSSAPRLVTVAHGTRVSSGNLVASAITARAARRLGRVPFQTSYVELCTPALADVMAENRTPAVVVPLLLSTGFHIKHDIPGAVGTSPGAALLARPLGPHPLLAEVMCLRLRGAGAHPGDPVVMIAAGSNDVDTTYDLAAAGRMLQARWGAPVRVATVSGIGLPINAAVDQARADGRVAVAPYLLSPGYFSRRARALSELAGVATVADVIGAHPLVAELVVRRYRAVLAASRAAA